MPILNVDNAQAVVVLKRSMNPGFAGIENPLFYNPKTVMLFGDAKESIDKLIADVKTALMAIVAAHMLLYTPEADAVRAVLRDVFEWKHVEDHPAG